MQDLVIEERRGEIIEMIKKRGRVRVSELSKKYNVSEVTIRTDLESLEKEGLLSRVHGGAVSLDKSYYKMNLVQRVRTHQAEKTAIAKQIASMVENDDTVMVNAGTTTLYVVRELRNLQNITIVTNSIPAALEAGQYGNINTILLGGEVNAHYQFIYGGDTLRRLSEYHADKAILSVDGICAENGISTYYNQEAEICRKMMEQSENTILAADFSKIGRTTLTQIAPLCEGITVVTNENAPENETKLIASKISEVVLV